MFLLLLFFYTVLGSYIVVAPVLYYLWQLLVVLVREFESRRGDSLNLFLLKENKDQLLRAPRVGTHNSTPADEGRKSSNFPAIQMQGTNLRAEGGRRACCVTLDLSYD